MRFFILFVLLFIAVNFAAILAHISLFQSYFPYWAWLSIAIHVLVLVIIPYKTIIKNTLNLQDDEMDND